MKKSFVAATRASRRRENSTQHTTTHRTSHVDYIIHKDAHMRPKYTLYAVPAGLVHISGAFTDDELVNVERALDAERWLSSSQAMCFSPLPTWVTRLGQKIKSLAIDSHAFAASDTTDDAFNFCQCIVNQYSKVDGLTPHVDLHAFGDVICSLSLKSSVMMDFTHTADASVPPVRVRLDPGDVLVLSGEARWTFAHGIAPGTVDSDFETADFERGHRISITLRTMDRDGYELRVRAPSP